MMESTMQTLLYQGLLTLRSYGDADDVLFLSSVEEPLADELQGNISGEQVTARYWITDQQATKDEANEAFMQTVMGRPFVEFYSYYSEITGYLWTDENIKIGGHDLLEELRSNVGKWLILEIDVHDGND